MSPRESDFDCPQLADAAAYVLGALEDDELTRYREHLEGCAQCRAEVAELQTGRRRAAGQRSADDCARRRCASASSRRCARRPSC